MAVASERAGTLPATARRPLRVLVVWLPWLPVALTALAFAAGVSVPVDHGVGVSSGVGVSVGVCVGSPSGSGVAVDPPPMSEQPERTRSATTASVAKVRLIMVTQTPVK